MPVIRQRQGRRGGRVLRKRVPRQPSPGRPSLRCGQFACQGGRGAHRRVHRPGPGVHPPALWAKSQAKRGGQLHAPDGHPERDDRYWEAIIGSGEESACGRCKDCWGFSWRITPHVLLRATTDPDRAAAKRAMEVIITMKKIDIATIEAARRGEGRSVGSREAFSRHPTKS